MIRNILFLAASALAALAVQGTHAAFDPASPLTDPGRFGAAVKYTGLSYHPDGGENEGYPRQLDDGAFWVLLIGGAVEADWRPHKYLYIRAATTFYKDCADLWAGYYHLGFRANYDIGPVGLRIGIGPTYLWRQNWYGRVKGYKRDSFFGEPSGGDFQDAFIWHGGDAEVEWKTHDHVSFVYSVIPGWPEVIQSSIGMRYNF
jgi:hypothetical protein